MPDEGISAANSRPRPVRDSILAAVRFFKILLHRQRPRPRCARDLLVSLLRLRRNRARPDDARRDCVAANPRKARFRSQDMPRAARRCACRRRVPLAPQETARRMARQSIDRKRRILPTCLAMLAAVCAWPAMAATWHVSGAGSDADGDGSAASPFRSIRRALDPAHGVVSAGDVVEIDGHPGQGRYDECDVRLRVRLTLRSAPGGRAHIHCDPDTPDSVTVQIDPDASGSVLSNLEISGGHYYGVMLQTNWYQGGPDSDTGASDVLLED